MERNKLLRIIQRDLDELVELTDELAGKTQISACEIEFALGKSRIVCQEFDYLRELNQNADIPEIPSTDLSSLKELLSEKDDQENKEAESAGESEEKIMENNDFPPDTPPAEQTEKEISEEEPGAAIATKTIAEIFVQEKSLNDTLAPGKTIDHKLSGSPLTKLEAAIGLNDRFQFIRELFNNDTGLFNQTVRQLDKMQDLGEAVAFLNSNFKWKKNETSMKFAQLVKRRFSN